eukprot:Sro763_g198870.2  (565) ;mRNA; r:21449-23143
MGSLPAFTVAVETGRESLLEQTRIKREERRRHQLEEKSVTKIQKVYRGWKTRQHVAGPAVLGSLWQQQQTETIKPTTEATLHQQSFLLSLRLSPPLLQAVPNKTVVDQWLSEHAAAIAKCQDHHNHHLPPYALSFRIVQMTLARWRPLQRAASTTAIFQQHLFTILEYYLKDASLLWKRMGGSKGLLLLLQSTQECLWWWQQQQQQPSLPDVRVFQTLWKWSCQAVNELEKGSALQNSAKALLAATVMGHHTGVRTDPTCSWWMEGPQQEYFLALVQHVVEERQQPTNEQLFATVLSKVLHGRWHIVLSNALDWQKQNQQQTDSMPPSTALLKFLHHVLTHHNDLAILTSVVVRGEDVSSVIFAQQALQQQPTTHQEEDEDEKMLEEEMEQQQQQTLPDVAATATTATATSQPPDANHKKHKSGANRKIAKQDLQTIPYLERIYQEERQRQKNQTLAALSEQAKEGNSATKAYAQSLVDMALQIGNPALWISWGELLLPQLQKEGESDKKIMDTTTMTSGDSFSACQVYVQLLARIMQSTTGLRSRTSASSPFLSQLAFAVVAP